MKIQLQNWFDVFRIVCTRGQEALQWNLPEAWLHAELYAELKKRTCSNGWMPFPMEVPYITAYPVQLPKKKNRDWKVEGAVKWVDLCLWSERHNAWCWFEFKVRHIQDDERHRKASLEARDVFRKDVVALMGFDLHGTADTWVKPDNYTKAYWFTYLRPGAESLRSGRHHFVGTFLQLDSKLDSAVWKEKVLIEEICKWFSHRNKQVGYQRTCPKINVESSLQPLIRNCSLLVCEWSFNSEEMSNDL